MYGMQSGAQRIITTNELNLTWTSSKTLLNIWHTRVAQLTTRFSTSANFYSHHETGFIKPFWACKNSSSSPTPHLSRKTSPRKVPRHRDPYSAPGCRNVKRHIYHIQNECCFIFYQQNSFTYEFQFKSSLN